MSQLASVEQNRSLFKVERKTPGTKSDTPEGEGVGFPKNNLGSVMPTIYI